MVLKQYIDGLVDVAVPVTGKSNVAVLQPARGCRHANTVIAVSTGSRKAGHAATRLKKNPKL